MQKILALMLASVIMAGCTEDPGSYQKTKAKGINQMLKDCEWIVRKNNSYAFCREDAWFQLEREARRNSSICGYISDAYLAGKCYHYGANIT